MVVESIITGFALSMDAFSVSICKGLSMKKLNYIQALIIAAFFGGFQALMPAIGYVLVKTLEGNDEYQKFITANAGLIAFILLVFLGGKMLWDVRKGKGDQEVAKAKEQKAKSDENEKLNLVEILLLAIATSIDALMTGFAYGIMQVNIFLVCGAIGIITFAMSFIGVFIGHFFGARWEKPASITGGVVLILLGFRFLLEYLGLI